MASANHQANRKPVCFAITPIGEPETEIRRRADGVFQEVLLRVGEELGYKVVRADHEKAPGIVTETIINNVISADLVIADLHNGNPNVLYELAIRHATGKPVVQMIPRGERLPFDISGLNTVQYNLSLESLEDVRRHLRQAITGANSVEAGDSNPIARARIAAGSRLGEQSLDQVLRDIVSRLDRLEREGVRRPRPNLQGREDEMGYIAQRLRHPPEEYGIKAWRVFVCETVVVFLVDDPKWDEPIVVPWIPGDPYEELGSLWETVRNESIRRGIVPGTETGRTSERAVSPHVSKPVSAS